MKLFIGKPYMCEMQKKFLLEKQGDLHVCGEGITFLIKYKIK